MAIARLARLGRHAKRPHGLCVKMTAVAILGLCFIFAWSTFSSSANSVTTQRESFDDIAEPVSADTKVISSKPQYTERKRQWHEIGKEEDKKVKLESDLDKAKEKKINGSASVMVIKHESRKKNEKTVPNVKKQKHTVKSVNEETNEENEKSESDDSLKEDEEEQEQEVVDGKEEESVRESEVNGETEGDVDFVQQENEQSVVTVEGESGRSRSTGKKRKVKGPVFDPKAHYSWKLCSTRSKHNYIPCIDNESGFGKFQSYRHTERSCPRSHLMCLVPLPHAGYGSPVSWPDSRLKVYTRVSSFLLKLCVWRGKIRSIFLHGILLLFLQILYKNVAHPKLAAYIKKHNWLVESGEYLTFPQNQSEFKGGVLHYLESIEEVSFFCR